MCGIIGITADHRNIVQEVVQGLRRLEYRGYDSAGFGLIECITGRLIVVKDVGRIDNVVSANNLTRYCAYTAIAHTRWATHGPPSRENAHPHIDCTGKIAVVHNGIIKNFAELKKELMSKGHRFVSETDTEVIPHFLEDEINSGKPMLEALRSLVKRLEGTYAIAILFADEPSKIYFARKLSPLVLGLGKGFNVVSSDIPSFLDLTRNVVVIEDGEIGYITPHDVYVEKDGRKTFSINRAIRVPWSISDAEKGGYPHFMLKEIIEQPHALQETLIGLSSEQALTKAVDILLSSDKIFITGAGTSFHAGLFFAYLASFIARTVIIPFVSSEYEMFSTIADKDTALIAVSQSGETIDTLQAVKAFKSKGAKVIAVSNVLGSSIPRESDIALYTRAGPEIGVAATKTFLTQILLLEHLLLMYALEKNVITENEFREALAHLGQAPRIVHKSIEQTSHIIERLAWRLRRNRSIYVLSRGVGVPLALEASLKIKEVSYIHAEAYPAGESKHGPIALVEEGFPVIFIGSLPFESMYEKIQGNIMEMKARGAFTILVAPNIYRDTEGVDVGVFIKGDATPYTLPYMVIPPLQLLAYRLAVILGYDPDKPRNLAKTVTVE
ncbi:MAG: glutamine--fructose-6-phosphate transaminase (isomerizing) [Pyrodictiaceae archaeon]